jgi:metal transporter CNNM
MSLGPAELKRKMELGDLRAAKIYPIRKKGDLLLVALLLGNVTVISTLSIFLESLTTGLIAVILSTLLITIFGEILPQAFFSRFALTLGALSIPLVKVVLWVFYPIAKPLAWMLNKVLGTELPELYSRGELIKILEEHKESPASDIAEDEERIARGALTFGDKTVGQVMTPRSQLKMVQVSDRLTKPFIKGLKDSGFSRFPVEDGGIDKVTAILYLRNVTDPSALGKLVKEVAESNPHFINESSKLDHVLNAFLKSKHHLFIVVNEFSEVVGAISIEDVLEEILDREIVGEFDKYEDLRAVAKQSS